MVCRKIMLAMAIVCVTAGVSSAWTVDTVQRQIVGVQVTDRQTRKLVLVDSLELRWIGGVRQRFWPFIQGGPRRRGLKVTCAPQPPWTIARTGCPQPRVFQVWSGGYRSIQAIKRTVYRSGRITITVTLSVLGRNNGSRVGTGSCQISGVPSNRFVCKTVLRR